MIKSLSPYYVSIPFVSPLTGLTCTSFTLRLYIWNGLKFNPPANPSYEVTKSNPTASTGNDKINIARLINDFIDFNASNGTTTEVLEGNNQQWVKWETFYETSNPADATTPSNVNTQLMLQGYSYGLDGANAQPPTNKILIPIQDYKVNRSGVFNIPVLVEETESTIEAVDETYNIFFQDTLIDVLETDNLGFEPTNIISVSSSIPSSVGTFTIEANKIKFTKGAGSLATPQTFNYTIQDSSGATSSAIGTVIITAVPATPVAQDETFSVNDTDVVLLDVLNNDALGTTPTTIVSFDDSLLTCGTLAIVSGEIEFTPNGTYGVTETFTYTIEDSTTAQDTATVTLNVTHLIGETEVGFRTLGISVNSGVCDQFGFISMLVETQTAGTLTDGDIVYTNSLVPFDGSNNYHKFYLDADSGTFYNVRINSIGVIEIQNVC